MTPAAKKRLLAALKWTLALLVFFFIGRELARSSAESRVFSSIWVTVASATAAWRPKTW